MKFSRYSRYSHLKFAPLKQASNTLRNFQWNESASPSRKTQSWKKLLWQRRGPAYGCPASQWGRRGAATTARCGAAAQVFVYPCHVVPGAEEVYLLLLLSTSQQPFRYQYLAGQAGRPAVSPARRRPDRLAARFGATRYHVICCSRRGLARTSPSSVVTAPSYFDSVLNSVHSRNSYFDPNREPCTKNKSPRGLWEIVRENQINVLLITFLRIRARIAEQVKSESGLGIFIYLFFYQNLIDDENFRSSDIL